MNRKKKVAERFAGAAEAVALVLLLLTLTARSLTLSRAHPFPVFDEVAYLDLARGFAARGGALATAACYASGRCLEDNRHPLYALALAPFVDGGPGDFARAKLLTLACALALVLVVYGAGRRLWGPGAALAAAALVALSWATALLSQQVLADVLFAALISRAWRRWSAARRGRRAGRCSARSRAWPISRRATGISCSPPRWRSRRGARGAGGAPCRTSARRWARSPRRRRSCSRATFACGEASSTT